MFVKVGRYVSLLHKNSINLRLKCNKQQCLPLIIYNNNNNNNNNYKRYLSVLTESDKSNNSNKQSTLELAAARKLYKGDVFLKGIKTNGTTLRFYDNTDIIENDEGYTLCLSGRKVRTPAAQLLTVPSELLAKAISIEWDQQGNYIKPTLMPLTHIAITAIDQMKNTPQIMLDSWRNTASHDNICYRADAPRKLVNLQKKYWDPLLKWAKDEYNINLITTTSLAPLEQNEEVIDIIVNYAKPLDHFRLSALDTVASVTKSAIMSMAFAENKLSLDEAYEASRVDENYQIKEYGQVDGIYGHGIDMEYCRVKLAAARVFFNWLPQTSNIEG